MVTRNNDPSSVEYFNHVLCKKTEKCFNVFEINDDTHVDVLIEKTYEKNTSYMIAIEGIAEIKMHGTIIAELSLTMMSSAVSSEVVIAILEDAIRKYDSLLSE